MLELLMAPGESKDQVLCLNNLRIKEEHLNQEHIREVENYDD